MTQATDKEDAQVFDGKTMVDTIGDDQSCTIAVFDADEGIRQIVGTAKIKAGDGEVIVFLIPEGLEHLAHKLAGHIHAAQMLALHEAEQAMGDDNV